MIILFKKKILITQEIFICITINKFRLAIIIFNSLFKQKKREIMINKSVIFFTLLLISTIIQMSCGYEFLRKYPKNLSVVNRKNDETRIVGGIPAVAGEFHGIVSIQAYTSHYCGGTYIHSYFVLTAAHCLIHQGGNYIYPIEIMRVVADDLLIDPPSDHRQTVRVSSIYPHSNFNEDNFSFDIGLIKLLQPFVVTPTFSIALLAQSTPVNGLSCSVAGWGTILYGEDETGSNVLLKVDINIINRSICNVQYGNLLPANTICAGEMLGGKDSCQGDSGGPLMCGEDLCGIVSFGNACALPNFPGVYTDVSGYNSWIQGIIETSMDTNTTTTASSSENTLTTPTVTTSTTTTRSPNDNGIGRGISLNYSILTIISAIIISIYLF